MKIIDAQIKSPDFDSYIYEFCVKVDNDLYLSAMSDKDLLLRNGHFKKAHEVIQSIKNNKICYKWVKP